VTHYQLLGVLPTASTAEIRAAYLQLARRWHPDAGGSAERMRALNAAWAVLGDTRRRDEYDVALGMPGEPDTATSRARPSPEPEGEMLTVEDFDDGPLHVVRPLNGIVTVLPIALFAASVVSGILGMMLMSGGLLGLAIVLFGASVALMILLPLIQMTRGGRRGRR
jgi:DnaJ domain